MCNSHVCRGRLGVYYSEGEGFGLVFRLEIPLTQRNNGNIQVSDTEG